MIGIKGAAPPAEIRTEIMIMNDILGSIEFNLGETPVVRVSCDDDFVTKQAAQKLHGAGGHDLASYTDIDGVFVGVWIFESLHSFLYWKDLPFHGFKSFKWEEIDNISDLLDEYSDVTYMDRLDKYKAWSKRLRCLEDKLESSNDGIWIKTQPLYQSPITKEETECDKEFLEIERRQELE